MTKQIQWRLASVWLAVFLLTVPVLVAQAADPLVPCNGINCTITDLFKLIINVYNFFLGLGGIVALLFIIWGGVQMILGFMDGGEHYVEAGKDTVKHGIIGLVILACGYLIVNTVIILLGGKGIDALINPFLGK